MGQAKFEMKVIVMAANNDTQCYFVQLQIDTFLDGELGAAQSTEFQHHVQTCKACAQELKFARVVYEGLLDLPQLDCDDQVLEPVLRLGTEAAASRRPKPTSWWQETLAWLGSVPVSVRYALPALLVIALVLPFIAPGEPTAPAAPLVAELAPVTPPEYSAQEIQKALADLNIAMQYLNEAGLRTEVMIGDRFLVRPVRESLNASFDSIRGDDASQNDPIF